MANRTQLCLSDLYDSENTLKQLLKLLAELFESDFDCVIKKGRHVKSLLIERAEANKPDLKEMYVEYGYKLENLEDLKHIIDQLKTFPNEDNCDFTNSIASQ